jgi:hypothetical protein
VESENASIMHDPLLFIRNRISSAASSKQGDVRAKQARLIKIEPHTLP